ncbi:MAG: hypothetical protein HYT22_03860 [Candidatus Niyogibacteria bacterium]|nr:hypothetical protein [Candidatus Niyogibacteria bacterium]
MFARLRYFLKGKGASTWLESIQAELEEITIENFAEPNLEVESGDHIVGIAGDDLRKLHALRRRYGDFAIAAKIRCATSSGPEHDEAEKEFGRFFTQGEAVNSIFWVSCRAAFPEIWDKEAIGIRKGWQVVWSDPDDKRAFTFPVGMPLHAELEGELERLFLGNAGSIKVDPTKFLGSAPPGDIAAGIRKPESEPSEASIGSNADLEEARRRFQAAADGEKESGKNPPLLK